MNDIIRGMHEARPAGFWIRAVALGVDLFVLVLVEISFRIVARRAWGAAADDSALVHGMTVLFTLAFAALYVTLLHAGTGQTIGKMLVHAHVVLVDGQPIPGGTALLRSLAQVASFMPFGLGYLMAALRHDKRAFHDLIAGTRVERRLPARAAEPLAPPEAPPEAIVPPVA
jgi:uncharacterized RDD family membrane protein YckC